MKNKIKKLTVNLLLLLFSAHLSMGENKTEAEGECVFSIVGLQKPGGLPALYSGMKIMADLAHKYGHPVTWYLKPDLAEYAKQDLKYWHQKYGDEVGWFAEHWNPKQPLEVEIAKLKEVVTWQKIRTAGDVKYDRYKAGLFEKVGMESVWGRCWDQSAADGICDRGCPWGFHYLNPEYYRVPKPGKNGLVSVEWVSRDLNLVFRTAWAEFFSFVSYDTMLSGVLLPGRCEYWFNLVDEYRRQAKYNKYVPVITMNEFNLFSLDKNKPSVIHHTKYGPLVFDELFKYLKDQKVQVMTVSDSVDKFKKLNATRTPPTYAYFDNLSWVPLVKDRVKKIPDFPIPVRDIKLQTERFKESKLGVKYNGYYAVKWAEDGFTYPYYNPSGIKFEDQPAVFIYYDDNGQLFFDPGNPKPIRVTSYLNLPKPIPTIVPEYSYWYGTDKDIPTADIKIEKRQGDLRVQIQVTADKEFPYGVMLWGDYTGFKVPEDAPCGTKAIETKGLFIPMVLKSGSNKFEFVFPKK
jgi:hypothetical protein